MGLVRPLDDGRRRRLAVLASDGGGHQECHRRHDDRLAGASAGPGERACEA